jgi:1-phosphatidylinositol phosphodiesterase
MMKTIRLSTLLPFILLWLQPLFAHYDASYYHGAGTVLPGGINYRWMKGLRDDLRVSELSLPGTHDSMATPERCGRYYVDFGISTDVCATQVLPLGGQLTAGIRALDIRARRDENTFHLVHGSVDLDATFDYVLDVIQEFLTNEKSEFILMRLKEEGDAEDSDMEFHEIFEEYRLQYPDLFWEPNKSGHENNPMLGTEGDPDSIRGKIVVLQNFYEPSWSNTRYGIEYLKVDEDHDQNCHLEFTQDCYALDNNWDLYSGKWERVERHINRANSPTSERNQLYVNFLSGSVGSFPYFVASGHSSAGTTAPRLATGATTPLFGDKWQKFPRVDCFLGICTIAFEGVNTLVRNQILNTPIDRRTGVLFMDFPGYSLIEAIIDVNPMPAPPGLEVTFNNNPIYGYGTVRSNDLRIDCAANGDPKCKADYADDGSDTAVLTAIPRSDSVFHSWNGPGVSCSGSTSCSIHMYGNRNVTPVFLLKPRLTVNPSGAGNGTFSLCRLAG